MCSQNESNGGITGKNKTHLDAICSLFNVGVSKVVKVSEVDTGCEVRIETPVTNFCRTSKHYNTVMTSIPFNGVWEIDK